MFQTTNQLYIFGIEWESEHLGDGNRLLIGDQPAYKKWGFSIKNGGLVDLFNGNLRILKWRYCTI